MWVKRGNHQRHQPLHKDQPTASWWLVTVVADSTSPVTLSEWSFAPHRAERHVRVSPLLAHRVVARNGDGRETTGKFSIQRL